MSHAFHRHHDIDRGKEALSELLPQLQLYLNVEMSETDTRCKVIDELLTAVLGWREQAIEREPHLESGYVDYILSTTHPQIVIEAKKSSAVFDLPKSARQKSYKIGGVLWDDSNLAAAITQARAYALDKGVSICCVSNGHQFVFFQPTNSLGINFKSQVAVVFRTLDEVAANFNEFWEILSAESAADGRFFKAVPVSSAAADDPSAKFKKIAEQHYLHDKKRDRNRLFPFTRKVIKQAFQDLAAEDAPEDILEQCYVESARDSGYSASLRELLQSRPILAERKVEPIEVTKKDAGLFQRKVEDDLASASSQSEVILLLGNVGAGKSTFIQRFRKVLARDRIEQDCIWAYVNFNKYANTNEPLAEWVANQILSSVEADYGALGLGSFSMLKQAYHAEYERLKRGRLEPLFRRDPAGFELEFGKELEKLENNRVVHLTKLLRAAARSTKRRPLLVFDNADQFKSEVQNEMFMLAHRIAQEVGCSLIISLREESYWKNKDFGALSAFHSTIFSVQAPRLSQVISKRFKYAIDALKHEDTLFVPSGGQGVSPSEAVEVINQLKLTILSDDSSYIEFLEHLSPGEIRRPLDQLARFLYSGHTNVDALVRAVRERKEIHVGFHEFFASVALGDNEYYDEDRSDIINLFQVDGTSDASNLNRLAVIARFQKSRNDNSEFGVGFVPVEVVIADCAAVGIQPNTVSNICALLNSRRLFETERQIREQRDAGLFMRSTTAARYYIESLGNKFVYVDMVLRRTPVSDGAIFGRLQELTRKIDGLGKTPQDRVKRIELRVKRAIEFGRYVKHSAQSYRPYLEAPPWFDATVRNMIDSLPHDIASDGAKAVYEARRLFQ